MKVMFEVSLTGTNLLITLEVGKEMFEVSLTGTNLLITLYI